MIDQSNETFEQNNKKSQAYEKKPDDLYTNITNISKYFPKTGGEDLNGSPTDTAGDHPSASHDGRTEDWRERAGDY